MNYNINEILFHFRLYVNHNLKLYTFIPMVRCVYRHISEGGLNTAEVAAARPGHQSVETHPSKKRLLLTGDSFIEYPGFL